MNRDGLILAIDAGTQSIRAALVDLTGNIHHLVKTPIEPYFSDQPGWAEQQPDYYWQMLCETTRQLLALDGVAPDEIFGVTLTTQRVTMINLDRDGQPLRPAIVWLDQRKADMGRVLPSFSTPLLKASRLYPLVEYATQYCRSNWIQQNQPEIWERTHKFVFLSGYFTYRLTGEFRDSAGNIVGTIPFDVKKSDWAGRFDPKWLMFPMEREKLPDLVKPTESLGHITEEAAEQTGIPSGLPFIAASNDKACDIIGSGCLTPETACISFGTTATINTQNEKYVELRTMLPPYPSAIPDEYYSEVAVVRGLWMVSWFKEEFGLQERLMAAESGEAPEDLLEELVRDVPAGSAGLVCQPYWTPGPDLEPYAKGAVFGFGDIHTRAYLYRAILEGIVFALKQGAGLTERKNGVPITEVRATGGGSRSDSIMQMTADIFDLPSCRPHTPETSVVGAAMDAAVGLGAFPDVAAAAKDMTRIGDEFTPDPVNRDLYHELYERVYAKTYGQLRPLYEEIQKITGYPKL
ncbi:MAG: FGGY-family carbohydrate kinase [Candidatus Nanopelagicales bacterium]